MIAGTVLPSIASDRIGIDSLFGFAAFNGTIAGVIVGQAWFFLAVSTARKEVEKLRNDADAEEIPLNEVPPEIPKSENETESNPKNK